MDIHHFYLLFVSSKISFSIIKSSEQSFRFLISLNLQFDARDKNQNTALHLATKNGNTKMVFKTMMKYSDFNARNNKNETPLSLSRKYKQTNIESLFVVIFNSVNHRKLDQL